MRPIFPELGVCRSRQRGSSAPSLGLVFGAREEAGCGAERGRQPSLSLGTPLLGALGEWHFAILGTLSDAVSTASASWANLQVKVRRC